MATSPYFNTSNQYIKYDIHVDEVSQSIPDNQTVVRVRVYCWRTNTGYVTNDDGTCYVNVDGVNYSNSWVYPEKPISYNSDTLLFDRNVTINHDADGKKTIYVSAYIRYSSRFSSNSQGFNVVLTDIPRQGVIISAPNFTDLDNPVINYSNPAGAIVTDLELCLSLSTTATPISSWRTLNKVGANYTYELNDTDKAALYAATPNSNTKTVYFIIKTVISGVTYYSNKAVTFTVANANPTITGAAYQDINPTTTALTGDNQKIIQNNSNLRFTVSGLTALKGASLAAISATIDGVTITNTLSGSTIASEVISFGVVNSSRDVTAVIALTDSRGNITTLDVPITVLGYEIPNAIITLARQNNYYDETDLNVNANYSYLEGNNNVTIQYQYKETTAQTYGPLTTIQDDVTYTISVDRTKSFNFRFIITDSLGGSVTYNAILNRGIPILFIDRLKRAVGVNRIPLGENSLETDGYLAFGGFWLSSFRTQGGQAGVGGYVRVATIKVLEYYANAPVEFKIFRRKDLRPVTLFLTFENSQYTDPNVNALKIDSLNGIDTTIPFSAFIVKTATSTWDLYIIKSEDWDDISIQTSISNYMFSHVNISYEDDLLTSKPAGAIDATTF